MLVKEPTTPGTPSHSATGVIRERHRMQPDGLRCVRQWGSGRS